MSILVTTITNPAIAIANRIHLILNIGIYGGIILAVSAIALLVWLICFHDNKRDE